MSTLKKQASMLKLLGGEVYLQNYEQKKELGRGKFGVVFQVEDRATNKTYAAKHIKTRKKEMKEKVIEEIAILKKFSNPHIIRFINAFETPSEVILVMEYLDGGELFERVADDNFNLTESDCCLFMRQICRGVQYLHKNNIVHLDLKPENVVCTQKENTSVKIIDFGMAKELEPTEKVKALCGTPEFVAPEVVSYDFISTGTDMWSLGVICYILISGYSPFMGDTDTETYANISNVTYDFDLEEFDIISQNAQDFISQLLRLSPRSRLSAQECLDHPWLLEKDIGQSVIKTDNLRAFLARRRWQRCGQAIRAMRRMKGLTKKDGSGLGPLSCSSSMESLLSSTEASPAVSAPSSPLASPVTARRGTTSRQGAESQSSPQSPNLSANRPPTARLNLLEEKLKEEFKGNSRLLLSNSESLEGFKAGVEVSQEEKKKKDVR